MSNGIVDERRQLFENMTERQLDIWRHRHSQPIPTPSLDSFPSHLPSPSQLGNALYHVCIKTANRRTAATDRDVYIQLVGDFGDTHFILLENASRTVTEYGIPNANQHTFDPQYENFRFPPGSVREFSFKANYVGNLLNITMQHDPQNHENSSWRPERVVIVDTSLQRSWKFLCPAWISRNTGNQITLRPTGDVSAGRRASLKAFRRLSLHKTLQPHSPKTPIAPADTFQTARDHFGTDSQHSVSSTADATEIGTRRVCFQLQKFTQTCSHVYLLGNVPALGEWKSEKALRMIMNTAADGTWRGEWRLELELDDDFDEITYMFMIVTESGSSNARRVYFADERHTLQLSSADSLSRPAGGGTIHVRNTIENSMRGLAGLMTPNGIASADTECREVIKTPRGDAIMVSSSVKRTRIDSAMRDSFKFDDRTPLNLESALESSVEDRSDDSVSAAMNNMVHTTANSQEEDTSGSEYPMGMKAPESGQGNELARLNAPGEGNQWDNLDARDDASEKEWKDQLEASDHQLLRSSEGVRQRQSEVMFLKKRNSRDMVREQPSPFNIPDSPATSEKTSPVSSDGMSDNEKALTADDATGVSSSPYGEMQHGRQTNDANELLAELERHRHGTKAISDSLQQQLSEMRESMTRRCEVYEAQYAEIVRLSMDARDVHAAVKHKLGLEKEELHARWAGEFKERRRLFNKVQELRGNIRVFCRVRPMRNDRQSQDASIAVQFPDAAMGEHSLVRVGTKSFEFDHVFDPNATQTDVYQETSGVVASVLDGYNVCVFAYGQTGSGKTHTMDGPAHDRGVNFRALSDLFAIAKERSSHSELTISVSIMEIYNESLRDLIAVQGSNSKLEIRKDPNATSANAVHVPSLTTVEVHSVEGVWEVLEQGMTNRSKGKTNMNEHSSRSHLILKVAVACQDGKTGVKSSGILHLVDLAGSERVGRSQASGDRLREAQHINKSLATLGDVFTALVTRSAHIPFRNSKLTFLLQNCLGGDSKTLMFVNISSDEADTSETLSSLQFAQRVAKVELSNAQKHVLKTTDLKANAALQSKESELQVLQAKYVQSQKELKKKEVVMVDMTRSRRDLEEELKSTKLALEEKLDKEESERESSAQQFSKFKLESEKWQAEARQSNQRLKLAQEMIASKEEELKKLHSSLAKGEELHSLKEKTTEGFRKAELSHRDSEDTSSIATGTPAMHRQLGTPAMHRQLSTPNVLRNKGESGSQGRLPRGAATFTGRTRQVRFEDSAAPGEPLATRNAPSEPPATPATGPRRAVHNAIPRSQSVHVARMQRSRSALTGTSTARKATYTAGSKSEGKSYVPNGSSIRPSRITRLPRSQTTVARPARRVQVSMTERSSDASLNIGAQKRTTALRHTMNANGLQSRSFNQGSAK